jgi:hypothetical protein
VLPVVASQAWVVNGRPVDGSPAAWVFLRNVADLRVPLYPYLIRADLAALTGFGTLLGIKSAQSVTVPIKAAHVAVGQQVERLDNGTVRVFFGFAFQI